MKLARFGIHFMASALAAGIAAVSWAETPPQGAIVGPIVLQVDATDVTHGIFRVRETVAVSASGPLVLLYPKWLPGYHAPAGPIVKLAGLVVSAAGNRLTWRRDPADVYAFHVDVPDGVATIDIEFQYLSAVTPQQGRIVTTPDLLALEWNTVVLYPQGRISASIEITPRVKLPAGWRYATALETADEAGATIGFRPVSLDVLVDSPLYAGRNFQRINLDETGRSSVWLNVMADRPAQIVLPAETLEAHRKLVRQADRLFGARPFERYEFLLTLSDRLGGYGLEHRRSSENSVPADYLLDWERSVNEERTLLSHEYVHSWNGKFRLSTGLSTPHFNAPVSDTLLWLYEGLTEYWGYVLAARSGLRTAAQTFEVLATLAATSEHRVGRSWRPLADTLYDPVIVGYSASLPWPNWQRGGDYYPEGPLLWLDIDTKIRELSGGKRSLDDFARLFFGMASPGAAPLSYDFDDVTADLNATQPLDWKTFLNAHLSSTSAPLDGLHRGGWRLVYKDTPSAFSVAVAGRAGTLDLSYSLGFVVGEDGTLRDVGWGSPAFDAGLTIGTRLVAVEDLDYDPEELKGAIVAAASAGRPVRLVVANGDRYRTVEIDTRSGLRFPHLERIAGTPDRIGAILTPRN